MQVVQVVLVVDPEIPVPPRLYGGIERIVDLLAHELMQRGHDVTLLAHPDSTTPCRRVAWRGARSRALGDTLLHGVQLADTLRRLPPGPRVIHSFARVAYMLPLLPLPIAKVQSYQRAVTPRSVRWADRLSRGTLFFTACSASCAASGTVAGDWTTVYNAVPVDRFRFVPRVGDDAPLMFLGRVERIKGAHHAIEVARRTGRRLLIAGNLPERGPDVEYARELVAQCDGDRIRYVGPVDDARKSELLGSAACLLMPIEWEEPFGIVMAEALACGTPVLGFARGSVPEVVEHERTGFVCHDLEQLIGAVARIPELDRGLCRSAAERRFSGEALANGFEAVYARALGFKPRS